MRGRSPLTRIAQARFSAASASKVRDAAAEFADLFPTGRGEDNRGPRIVIQLHRNMR
jgi:hypothetical protein